MNLPTQPPDPRKESKPEPAREAGQTGQHNPQRDQQDGDMPPGSPAGRDSTDAGHRMGRVMIIGFWLILLALAYTWASRHLDFMNNPNTSPLTRGEQGRASVELAMNHYGHYVATGSINDTPVDFLLDTGATSVSIPAALAARLNLKRGAPIRLSTANGVVTGYAVTLESVAIGGLERTNVRAHINPGLPEGEVLLGMSYLRHFQLIQRGNSLTIEEYR